ncbi:hypothetical protein K438DRAFT_1925829 [Mycena galopus ATCC 62051]|nr:hypothetical protein K438DRAFT_1925829 [Mycena galopus ATCC 62051]
MSSPAAKRQRTENASITRSESWFSDGNVVLQAAKRQFRVHWGVLALHSSVFHDMQGLPQPPDQPTVDGCPVVELFDDPDDVEYLLKALYIPTFHSQERLPLPAVGALIRLGRKYEVKDLFASAVARLTAEYPTTLDRYDTVQQAVFSGRITETYADIDVIALANETNLQSVLPSAYYHLVERSTLNQLLTSILPTDGETSYASLSPVDVHRCVVGHQKLFIKQFQRDYTLGWTRQYFPDCTDAEDCRISRKAIMDCHLDDAEIGALDRPSTWVDSELKFCPECKQHMRKCMTIGRKKIWKELPEIFGLPTWSELKNDM